MGKLFPIFVFTLFIVSLGFGVTVTDSLGRIVHIEEPVKKVIANYGLLPPFIYLLGEGDKFYAGMFLGKEFYKLLDEKVQYKVLKGRSLNIEFVKKENPQVVISAYWQANQRDMKQLEALGIPVVFVKLESVEDINNTIRILGKIFGKEEKAEGIINYYSKSLSDLKDYVKGISTKPSVLIVFYDGKTHSYRTFGGDMFQSKLVELAGGICASRDLRGKKTINAEQVARWDPDVILIIQYRSFAQRAKEFILADPLWKRTKAAREGRVYIVPNDGENWIDPCPKWILGLYWCAKILHPEILYKLDLKKMAEEFYERFFNLGLERVEIMGDFTF